jgi:uncharacterized protein (UPF0218 family)
MEDPKKSYLTNDITSEILYGQEDGTVVIIKLKKLAKHYNEMSDF